MALLGAILLRLSFTDAYLRYVTPWMKWPLAVTGVALLALAIGLIVAPRTDAAEQEHEDDGHDDGHDDEHGHAGHGVPLATWLLILPAVVTFVISPPELGAYTAERRAGEAQVVAKPDDVAELDPTAVVEIDLLEFLWRAQEGGETLEGQPVALTGFVSYGGGDEWFVTQMSIGCCAADATAYRVRITDAERPDRDTWVEVTGVYETGTGIDPRTPPVLTAAEVEQVEAPRNTYR